MKLVRSIVDLIRICIFLSDIFDMMCLFVYDKIQEKLFVVVLYSVYLVSSVIGHHVLCTIASKPFGK